MKSLAIRHPKREKILNRAHSRQILVIVIVSMLTLAVLAPAVYYSLIKYRSDPGKMIVDSGVSGWGIPLMAITAFAEIGIQLIRGVRMDKKDALVNIGFGAMVGFVGITVRTCQWLLYVAAWKFRIFEFDWSLWSWTGCILCCEFVFYWYHRMGHEVIMFWAAHYTHHSSHEFTLSVGFRNSIIHICYRYIFWAPVCLLGFHPIMVITIDAFTSVYQYFLHTERIPRLGIIEKIINTPSNHRVHHGRNDIYLDKNYGGMLVVYDQIFGTYEPESEAVSFGLKDGWRSYNLLKLNFQKWSEIIRKSRHSSLLKLFFGKPGDDL